MTLPRRQFLRYLGIGTYAALLNPLRLAAAAPRASTSTRLSAWTPSLFEPIHPSTADRLRLPAGYRADLLGAWGDELGFPDPTRNRELTFGNDNDFLAYFPLASQHDSSEKTVHDNRMIGRHHESSLTEQGLLWVNHESPHPLFVSGYSREDAQAEKPKTAEQIQAEKRSVGGSVLYLRRGANGHWRREYHHRYTCRYTACGPRFGFDGPAAEAVASLSGQPDCPGTLANCSGGTTPWHSVLSCEENYHFYNPQTPRTLRWSDQPDEAIAETQFGWVVEVDPFGELPPVKHTSLGRFSHENIALRCDGPTGRLVAYMGDDKADECVYKFVSAQPLPASASRLEQRAALSRGTLYAADFQHGRWVALDWNVQKNREKWQAYNATARQTGGPLITSQADILIHTRIAARVLGATPLDRPEDCEIHPADGSVYIALTNNTRRANFYGQIVRLIEDNDNPEGERFRFELFLLGGRHSGLACPDNLAFDRRGNLWVACDIASSRLGRDPYQAFGNNGLFMVPTTGPGAGQAYQFASGPTDCELTGPWFSANDQTLFLSVQHPGGNSPSLERLSSHWPHGGRELPRPGVVAITGFGRV
jgi:secreted PhoX family phosphatase